MAVGIVLDVAAHSGIQNSNLLDTHQGIGSSEWLLADETKTNVSSDPISSMQVNPESRSEFPVSISKTSNSGIETDSKHREAKQSAPPVGELYHTKRGEWCATMVCYIWFAEASRLPIQQANTSGVKRKWTDSQTGPNRKGFHRPARSMNSSISSLEYGSSRPSRIQVFPTERFVYFVINILRTTQVSYSVVLVSLYYIYRLKMRHSGLVGQHGSEYRLFLTSLILANKFLDDYTYTNKTWADLSKTPLKEVTKMELQMYTGMGANANVTPSDYAWWCTVLKGLKHQREIDRQWLHCKESASCIVRSPLSWSVSSSPISVPLNHTLSLPGTQHAYTGESEIGKRKRSWSTMNGREGERRIQSSPNLMSPGLLDNGYALQSLQVPTPVSSTDWPCNGKSMWTGGSSHEQGPPKPLARTPAPYAYSVTNDLIPSTADARHSIPANIDTVNPIRNLGALDSAVPVLQSRPMVDMELFGPCRHFSPPFLAHPSTNTSPIVLAYYRLAAGYPYGIPASTNVGAVHNRPFFAPHPIFESSKSDVNMFISPPGSGVPLRSTNTLHFDEPFTHISENWPGTRIQNSSCGDGDVGAHHEIDDSVSSIPVQSFVSTGFPGLNAAGPSSVQYMCQQ